MTDTQHSMAFLFPGQGSQSVGMGKELAAMYPVAQQTFEEAEAALGYPLSQVCFEGPEDQLKLTEITQPAILTVSVAAWRVLRETPATHVLVRGSVYRGEAAAPIERWLDRHGARVAARAGADVLYRLPGRE